MVTLVVARLIRFGAEAILALRYGRGVLAFMESPPFRTVVIGFIVLAVAGSAATAYRFVATTRRTSSARR